MLATSSENKAFGCDASAQPRSLCSAPAPTWPASQASMLHKRCLFSDPEPYVAQRPPPPTLSDGPVRPRPAFVAVWCAVTVFLNRDAVRLHNHLAHAKNQRERPMKEGGGQRRRSVLWQEVSQRVDPKEQHHPGDRDDSKQAQSSEGKWQGSLGQTR